MRLAPFTPLVALLLTTAAGAQSLGAATKSPPPAGVQAGQGAANPKGHYAALDKLPDNIPAIACRSTSASSSDAPAGVSAR